MIKVRLQWVMQSPLLPLRKRGVKKPLVVPQARPRVCPSRGVELRNRRPSLVMTLARRMRLSSVPASLERRGQSFYPLHVAVSVLLATLSLVSWSVVNGKLLVPLLVTRSGVGRPLGGRVPRSVPDDVTHSQVHGATTAEAFSETV